MPYVNRRGRGLPPRMAETKSTGSAGVACPECGGRGSHVLDSRPADELIRRVRCCSACGFRFATVERVEGLTPPAPSLRAQFPAPTAQRGRGAGR